MAASDHFPTGGAPAHAGRTMRELFTPEPAQWGLRGDPYLWTAMRDHLADVPLPADPGLVRDTLRAAFIKLAGTDVDDPAAPESVHRDEFAHGGMSSGHIHLPTWRDQLIPLLVLRAR